MFMVAWPCCAMQHQPRHTACSCRAAGTDMGWHVTSGHAAPAMARDIFMSGRQPPTWGCHVMICHAAPTLAHGMFMPGRQHQHGGGMFMSGHATPTLAHGMRMPGRQHQHIHNTPLHSSNLHTLQTFTYQRPGPVAPTSHSLGLLQGKGRC